MSRQNTAVELNKFNAGLVTDASPLTAPDNSSLDELNMVLNTDGSRNRRLGMDYEEDHTLITTTIPYSTDLAHSSFRWKNAGGEAGRSIAVIQFGNEIKMFDLSTRPISGNLLYTYTFAGLAHTKVLSYSSTDGMLVAVTGEKLVYIFEISGNTVTVSQDNLKIRDLFGVEDISGGNDLANGSGVQIRPGGLTSPHVYNLRNQSFGVPRANNVGTVNDPINEFFSKSGSTAYPSNSDNVLEALYADTSNATDRTLERFFASDLYKNPLGTTQSAQGYFIIDALERGPSRTANDATNRSNYSALTHAVNTGTVPADTTPGGATVVGEYAGRAWFSGFSGELIDGDSESPRMSSYILFSKLVKSKNDITECYQEGDPTSRNAPDIVDTDGGFIRISEAYGISKLISVGGVLMVIAENGVWTISGEDQSGFTATGYVVNKVSDRGCVNPQSIITVDNSIFYWSEDGIYQVKTNQFGGWESGNISIKKIQRHFEAIPRDVRNKVIGSYDDIQRKVRWVYDLDTGGSVKTKELILDITLTGFYLNEIQDITNHFPKVTSVMDTLPYQIQLNEDTVVVGADEVEAGGIQVIVSTSSNVDVRRGELSYITVHENSPFIKYTFANYTDEDFIDWLSYDSVGTDAPAYLVTSQLSGTDFQRGKNIPTMTIHLRRTETGLTEDNEGNLVVSNPSSCKVQVRWDWAKNNNGNRWSREFQAYRQRRPYIAPSLPDAYDDGFQTVITRNKIRGYGKVASIRFSTDPGKDLHLYGWSMVFSMAGSP